MQKLDNVYAKDRLCSAGSDTAHGRCASLGVTTVQIHTWLSDNVGQTGTSQTAHQD